MSDIQIEADNGALARALGWFSIGLGVVEFVAPGSIKKRVGTPGPRAIVRSYGLREIATGFMILASDKPQTMVWGRVAGDILDIATLLPALRRKNPHRLAADGALLFVAAATALDLLVAMRSTEEREPVGDLVEH
jgi:hypothetical protein